MDMAQWANCMLSWNALPPDPAIVGDGWREQWRERLEGTPNFLEAWLAHQLRDDYWRHGSACESYAAIRCPVIAIAGWTDGYTDAAFRLLEHLDVPRRALVGPWGHNDPVHGVPAPAVGSLGECVRFYDRWLKGIENGVDDEPQLIAWLQDSVAAARTLRRAPGALDRRGDLAARGAARAAPPPRRRPDARGRQPGAREVLDVRGSQTTGLDGGAWCADGHSDDLPFDQRADDGKSLCFDSAAARVPVELLGPRGRRPHADQRSPARARERAPLRGAAGRRVAARDARPAQPHAPRGPRPRRPARPRRALRGRRSARRHRSPLRGGLAHPRRDLADLLAARVAVARAGHARRRRRRELDRCSRCTTPRAAPRRARAVPAGGAAGVSDDRARSRARRPHDHARARHRPHASCASTGISAARTATRRPARRSRSRPMPSTRSTRTSRSRRASCARTRPA